MTSSPRPTPSARSTSAIASVPVPTPTACRGAGGRGELTLERLDLGPEDEPAAGHDPLDRGADIGGVLVQRQRQERHAQAAHTRSAARPG